MTSNVLAMCHRGLLVAWLVLTACSTRETETEPESPADVLSESGGSLGKEPESSREATEEARHEAASGLPEGPCQKAVPCEEVQVPMKPYFIWEGRKICFWDQDARCECAEQLGVDDHAFCSGLY